MVVNEKITSKLDMSATSDNAQIDEMEITRNNSRLSLVIEGSNDSINRSDSTATVDYLDDNEADYKNDYSCWKRFFKPVREGSLRGSIFSLASITFDTTCLSFPFAIDNMGLIPGTLLLFLMCGMSCWTLYLLMKAGRNTRIIHYRNLIVHCLGHPMAYLSDVNNIIFSLGAQVAYIVTISKFFEEIIKHAFSITEFTKLMKITQMLVSMIFVQIPLSLIKNISTLQYASLIGTFVLIFLMVVMFIESFYFYDKGISENRHIVYFKDISLKYLDSFSIYLFAFSPHNGFFLIIKEMTRPNLRRTQSVIHRSIFLQLVFFVIIGYSGFFSLLEKVPNIFISRDPLANFDPHDYLMQIVKILFFISLHCMCAINFNLLRGTISSLCFKGKDMTQSQNIYVTSIMFTLSNFVAFFSKNVVDVIGIVSGISVSFICYIFPILCFIKTNNNKTWENVLLIIFLIIIFSIGLLSTGWSMIEYFQQ